MKRLAALGYLIALVGCESLPAETSAAPIEVEAASLSSDVSAEQRGAEYARVKCSSCHSVGRVGDSPLAAAPRFRSLGLRYPVENLAEAFAEGIDTAHPAMPEFVLSSRENTDLIAYLKSIQSSANR
ncbi:c-type cytochrome [Brevundimonas sp.]